MTFASSTATRFGPRESSAWTMWAARGSAIVGLVDAYATATPRRPMTPRSALDIWLPFAICVLAQIETWTSDASARPALAVLALAMTVPLFWLRRHALLVFVVVMSGTLVLAVTDALNPLY